MDRREERPITHDELVSRAIKWLYKTNRCRVVISERLGGGIESPDAIGWKNTHNSILVECKANRSDFLNDKRKPFRNSQYWGMGLGQNRYYFSPPNIIGADEVPSRWGLIELRGNRVKVVKKAESVIAYDLDVSFKEQRLLVSYLSNVMGVDGFFETEQKRLGIIRS